MRATSGKSHSLHAMTDGQSFFFVLTLFYLIECFKFAPPGSEALVSRVGKWGNCSLRQPFIFAWGLKKAVFLAPLFPWPASMYFVPGYDPNQARASRITLPSSIGHHHRFLQKALRPIRILAILNLLNFFLILPLVYVRTYDVRMIILTLALCYATLLATAIYYRRLHKRILPSYDADRFKTTIYTALLPWHAPRCADEILLKSSLRWSPLAALAANAKTPAILEKLKYHWRAAHYHPRPRCDRASIAETLRFSRIDPNSWLDKPADLLSPQYCPCCHNGYEKEATRCTDCDGVELKSK